MATERAKAIVDLDGQEAGKQLDALKDKAKELRNALKEAEQAGDFKSAKKLRNEIKLNSREQREFKKATREVNVEMEKLNGMTFNQLRKAYGQLKKARDNAKPNTAEWKKYDNQMGQLKKRMDEVNGSMKRTNGFMSSFKSLLPALGLATVVAAVGKFGKELYNLAIQLEGDNRRASIVFGDSLKYVEQQAESLAQKMGLTNKEFVAAAANTADLLIPLDFTREAAADMAVELQGMAGALDEWTGGRLGAAEVSNILTKAMLGENEQLKQLGIAIRKDSEEFRNLVEMKMQDETVTKAQAEAMATLELIQKKSADAQSAYLIEGNKLLRWQKDVSVMWKQLKEDIVSFATEGLKSASTVFSEQAKSVKNLEDNIVPLLSRYDELTKKTSLSESEQSELNDIIVTIGNNLPGAITQFDEYGKAIGISKEKAEELIKVQKAMLLVQNADAIREQEEALEAVNTKIAMYSRWVTQGYKGIDEFGNKIMLTNEETAKWTTELNKLGTQKIGLEALIKSLKGETIIDPESPKVTEKVVTTIATLKEELKELKEAREQINIEDKVALDQNAKEILQLEEMIRKFEDIKPVVENLEKTFGDLPGVLKISTMESLNLGDNILSDEATAKLQGNLDILIPSLEYIQQLFANPEEEADFGGVLSQYLFGMDWDDMDLSQKVQAVGDLAISTLSDINKIISNNENQQLMEFKNNTAKKKELLNKQLNDGIISYEEYTARTAQLDEELDKKQRKIAHDQAVRAKALAIMNAVLNTATAVISALATSGPPWVGIAMAAIVGALGALQIGVIASEPVPQYAKGNYMNVVGADDGRTYSAAIGSGSGLYRSPTLIPGLGLVGEQSPELVFSGPDTQKILNTPALLDAINYTIGSAPQFAAGNSTEIIREKTFTDPALLGMLEQLNAKMDQPSMAVLVANEDYVRTTKEVQNSYDSFQRKVN